MTDEQPPVGGLEICTRTGCSAPRTSKDTYCRPCRAAYQREYRRRKKEGR